MKIGIIGAGQIGGTLARRFCQLGHDVFIANSRGPQSLAQLSAETGAIPATTRDAARHAEVVIVTIPERNISDLPKDLFAGVPDRIVVVDTGNYYPRNRDGRIGAIEDGMTESEWVSQQFGCSVIKAFNTIHARHLLSSGRPPGAPGRIAIPVAGDDLVHKAVVLSLVEELGFDAIDAGCLRESWRQQPGTPVYCANLDADGVRRALEQASPLRQPSWRAHD